MATYRAEPPVSPEILTFSLNNSMVYVKAPEDISGALDMAQTEFAGQLAHVERSTIGFYITGTVNGSKRPIRISGSAWAPTVSRLLRHEIIEIIVPGISEEKLDPPPQYLEVPAPKANPRGARSAPGSRRNSPSPSPSHRSWFGLI